MSAFFDVLKLAKEWEPKVLATELNYRDSFARSPSLQTRGDSRDRVPSCRDDDRRLHKAKGILRFERSLRRVEAKPRTQGATRPTRRSNRIAHAKE
jgi:hypothetical protein